MMLVFVGGSGGGLRPIASGVWSGIYLSSAARITDLIENVLMDKDKGESICKKQHLAMLRCEMRLALRPIPLLALSPSKHAKSTRRLIFSRMRIREWVSTKNPWPCAKPGDSEEWFRSTDLRVMGPARCHCATSLPASPGLPA